jgi:hypothetical protein
MHESKDCPLLSMPKPVAITYGVSRNELMFHEVPASAEVTFKHDSGKIGRISVTGGTLSAQEIINELQWIIPCNHQWDLIPTEDGAFKVLFPSKADLARMTKIINVPVPDTNMFLHFEEWSAADLDKFCLSSVWVRVHGVCYKERCDYLSLFGVGSLIGKTKEVDMAFTRSHTVVRMLVEVTRVEHLPTTTVDHTYDGQGYGLLFKLESQPGKEKDDVVMNEVTPDDDAADEKGKGKELPKGTNLTQGDASASTQVPNTDRPQNNPNLSKQVGASMPVCRVGQIDCPRADPPWSDSKVYTLKPRKLWADYSSDEEDTIASPLSRLTSPHMFPEEVNCSFASQGGGPDSSQLLLAPTVTLDTAEKPEIFSDEALKQEVFSTAVALSHSSTEGQTVLPAAVDCAAEVISSLRLADKQAVISTGTTSGLLSTVVPSERVDAAPSDAQNSLTGSPGQFTGTYENSVQEQEKAPSSCTVFSEPFVSDTDKEFYSMMSVGLPSYEHPTRLYTPDHTTSAGTRVFLGGRLSVDKVVAFGGISPPSVGARSSQRIKHQKDADATQMERAQNLAKAKETSFSSGNAKVSDFTLSSIPDDVFTHRAKVLGVSLGTSPSQVYESIRNIKEVDNKRNLIVLHKNLEEANKINDPSYNEILHNASSLSTDLEQEAQISPEGKELVQEEKKLKVYKRREKVIPKVVRRSVRISKKSKTVN